MSGEAIVSRDMTTVVRAIMSEFRHKASSMASRTTPNSLWGLISNPQLRRFPPCSLLEPRNFHNGCDPQSCRPFHASSRSNGGPNRTEVGFSTVSSHLYFLSRIYEHQRLTTKHLLCLTATGSAILPTLPISSTNFRQRPCLKSKPGWPSEPVTRITVLWRTLPSEESGTLSPCLSTYINKPPSFLMSG